MDRSGEPMSKYNLDAIDKVEEGYPHEMRDNRRKEARDSGDGSRAWVARWDSAEE